MPDPVAYTSASDRWLAEYLDRCAHLYRSSAEYRRALNQERAPLFASTTNTLPRLAA